MRCRKRWGCDVAMCGREGAHAKVRSAGLGLLPTDNVGRGNNAKVNSGLKMNEQKKMYMLMSHLR